METFKINSTYNNLISLKISAGHFVTSSSHINYFIDLTTLKTRANEAKAVAKSMVGEYLSSTVVDTIICMDGTEVIGAYLADELTSSGIMSMNAHETIYVVTPEQNSTGQLVFRDSIKHTIYGKNILVLLATATTGRTLEKSLECIEYYGGTVAGVSAIFSAAEEVNGYKVNSIFRTSDIDNYSSYSSNDCPLCKAKAKIDGIISKNGSLNYNM